MDSIFPAICFGPNRLNPDLLFFRVTIPFKRGSSEVPSPFARVVRITTARLKSVAGAPHTACHDAFQTQTLEACPNNTAVRTSCRNDIKRRPLVTCGLYRRVNILWAIRSGPQMSRTTHLGGKIRQLNGGHLHLRSYGMAP